MDKKDIQERVTQNGKKLALSKFSWDAKNKAKLTVVEGQWWSEMTEPTSSPPWRSGEHSRDP